MKHYILCVWLRPPGEKPERAKKYLVSVWQSVVRKKHAVALALGVICGTERGPFIPFSWKSEKVRPLKRDVGLGKPWLERDEFEVRKLEDVSAKFIHRS